MNIRVSEWIHIYTRANICMLATAKCRRNIWIMIYSGRPLIYVPCHAKTSYRNIWLAWIFDTTISLKRYLTVWMWKSDFAELKIDWLNPHQKVCTLNWWMKMNFSELKMDFFELNMDWRLLQENLDLATLAWVFLLKMDFSELNMDLFALKMASLNWIWIGGSSKLAKNS